MSEPRRRTNRLPESDDEIHEMRERVRAEHAAYMKKWSGWKPADARQART